MATFPRVQKRRVLNDSYVIDVHHMMFMDPPAVVSFFLKALRYSVWPASKKRITPPSAAEEAELVARVRKRWPGHTLDLALLSRFLDTFNAADPDASLDRAADSNATETDRCQFSAARFLRNEDRMRRLKPEYKANRINKILLAIEEERNDAKPEKRYPVETLHAVFWYVKDFYLPNRSHYAKR